MAFFLLVAAVLAISIAGGLLCPEDQEWGFIHGIVTGFLQTLLVICYYAVMGGL